MSGRVAAVSESAMARDDVMLLPVPWDHFAFKAADSSRFVGCGRMSMARSTVQRLFNIAHIPSKLPAGSANLFDPFPLNPDSLRLPLGAFFQLMMIIHITMPRDVAGAI